jgi:hypothetical protein
MENPAAEPEPEADAPEPAVPDLDTTRPHMARIYDYFLGGKNHFAADRETADQLLKTNPSLRTSAREHHHGARHGRDRRRPAHPADSWPCRPWRRGGGLRGLVGGRIFGQDGTLVASVAQETLVHVPKDQA